jgi:hypothetical protein
MADAVVKRREIRLPRSARVPIRLDTGVSDRTDDAALSVVRAGSTLPLDRLRSCGKCSRISASFRTPHAYAEAGL